MHARTPQRRPAVCVDELQSVVPANCCDGCDWCAYGVRSPWTPSARRSPLTTGTQPLDPGQTRCSLRPLARAQPSLAPAPRRLDLGRRPPSDGRAADSAAAQRRSTPGDFTGYGFDQCLAPTQTAMDAWLAPLAVPGRRHLHLRRLPRLPQPAQPDPDLGQHPARARAGGCCRSPSARRPPASPRFPRYGNDPVINPDPGTDGRYATARRQGTAEATKTVTAAQALGIVAGQHAVVRPRGLRHHQHRLPRVRAGVPQRLDPAAARARLRLRRLLQRRLGHRDARQRAGATGPTRSRCPTRSGSPAGTARPTRPRRTSATTAGSPRGRVKQYQGGHDETWGGVTDQHRPRLPRPRHGLGRARPRRHCDGVTRSTCKYRRTRARRTRR